MVREMDCSEIRELLDGYALGAADAPEVKLIEEHVADCVRCWEELSSSQATAALLALAVRIEHPSASLEQRIVSQARHETTRRPELVAFWRRLFASPWPATASAFGAVSVAALVISGMLFMRMEDVQNKNDDLQTQIQAAAFNFQQTSELTNNQLADQEAIFSILADTGHEEVEVNPRGDSTSQAYYSWSSEKKMGVMLCDGLPSLPPGQVYVIWFTAGSDSYPMRQFISSDGSCQVTLDLTTLGRRPDGIAISIESAPGDTTKPNKPWFMYGAFPS